MKDAGLDWAQGILGSEVVGTEQPAGLGGQNRVRIVSAANGRVVVLREGSPDFEADFRSGLEIRARLRSAGVIVPASIGCRAGSGKVGPMELMERLPGADLEVVASTMSGAQARAIARRAAGVVSVSCTLFEAQAPAAKFGRDRLGECAPHATWPDACDAWLGAVRADAARFGVAIEPWIGRAALRLRAMRASLCGVPRKAFVWDVAERNVMVEQGTWSGLVDQDTLHTGDPLIVPALARVALARRGAPWADAYSREWLRLWRVGPEGRVRVRLYEALYALQFAVKAGRVLPDGRHEPALPEGMLERFG